MYLMLRYAMDDLGYRRMQWRCNALNAASRRAARRLGFRFEGIFYNHMIFKGRNRDTAWYSILDDEWPEVREIMERWLAPSNFDHGTAKTSLGALMENAAPAAGCDVRETAEPLLAQRGHGLAHCTCPLSVEKRSWGKLYVTLGTVARIYH